MGLFTKEGEYVDYTLLKKKGLMKVREQEAQKNLKTEGGFVDFTSLASADSPPNTPQTSTNNFNPLANFDSITPSTSASSIPENMDGKELNALKLKMDDMEYKLDRFIERIDKLEEKLARQGNF